MKSVIGVVAYGVAGNIFSIKKALKKVNAEVVIVETESQLSQVDKIILPGVGSFKDGIDEINGRGLYMGLRQNILKKPTLGICLGMQILSKIGYEFGRTTGLDLLNAEVKPMLCTRSVPHMGFNKITVINQNPVLDGLNDELFYFMHSYEVVNYTDIAALSIYSDHQFVSSIAKNGIFGVQFHPEQSRDAGIQLFKNFVGM